jgi:hypothetical protein
MLRAPMRRPCLAFALLALIALPGCQRKIGAPCRVSTDCSIRGDRVCDLSHLVDGDGEYDPKGKGECTIDGCNTTTCPREGTCVQVYGAEFLSVACDPELEDRPQAYGDDMRPRIAACHADPPLPLDVDGNPLYCTDPELDPADPACVPAFAGGEPLRCSDPGLKIGDAGCVPTYPDGQAVACNDCSSTEICLPEGLCADVLSARTSCRKRCRSGAQCRDGYECRATGSNGVYPVSSPDQPFGADDVKICMPIRSE